MPPRITNVKWRCNGWLPEGLLFDENTGTFTGTPHEVGEYTLPITVRTNYGEDTKDVVLVVEEFGYRVFVRPAYNFTSSTGSETDTDFFYALDTPKFTALSEYLHGFRAYTKKGDIYGCGLTSINEDVTGRNLFDANMWKVSRTLAKLTSPAYVRCVGLRNTKRNSYDRHYLNSAGFLSEDGKLTIQHVVSHSVVISGGDYTERTTWEAVSGDSIQELPVLDIGTCDDGIRWLSEDGTQDCCLQYTTNGNWYNPIAKLITNDLGYKAIKLISPAPFNFLSEDRLLDNNPNNFTHGEIKDAWGYGSLMYVQTTQNQLYEYSADDNEWNLLGTYDVKKIEIPYGTCMLMLTHDGRLFHMGGSLSAVDVIAGGYRYINAHETLTQIFLTWDLIDFTYSRSVPALKSSVGADREIDRLIVLKE